MNELLKGVRRFQEDVFPTHAALFAELKDGQAPHTLFITCADSRIDPALITQTRPGELFVVRNAGNAVPPSSDAPHSESASVQFAVDVLKVRHAVVCGHSGCGAMAAIRDGVKDLPLVERWLQFGVSRDEVGTPRTLEHYVERNVVRQLQHLQSYTCVQSAVERGALSLHGWVYDIGSGDIFEYASQTDAFVELGSSSSLSGSSAERGGA